MVRVLAKLEGSIRADSVKTVEARIEHICIKNIIRVSIKVWSNCVAS